MSQTVERSSLDLRYEDYRLRNSAAEARLLASISERGIEEPLGGVDTPQGRLLLDGSVGPERIPARPDPEDADWYLPLHLRHAARSEERRVGKERRSRWSPYH